MATLRIKVMDDREDTGREYAIEAEVEEIDLLSSAVRGCVSHLQNKTDMRETVSCHRVEVNLVLSHRDMTQGVFFPQLRAVLVNSVIGAFEDVQFKASCFQCKSVASPEYSIEVLMREVV